MLGSGVLLASMQPGLLAQWRFSESDKHKFGFGVQAATAAAAQRLARAATETLLVSCKADAYSAPAPSRSVWGKGTCPLGYTSADQLAYLKVRALPGESTDIICSRCHSL